MKRRSAFRKSESVGWEQSLNKNKAGKGSMSNEEMSALNDKHLNRIIEYLRSIGWTEEKILAFIQYITE